MDRQFWLDTLSEFWLRLGDKEFWNNKKKREVAVHALAQDYMRTDHDGYTEEDACSFHAVMLEYDTRSRYMLKEEANNGA